jgi:Spy/CpxP family protein refolding chaperone
MMGEFTRAMGLILGVVAALGVVAPRAGAEGPRGGPGPRHRSLDRMLERDAERIGLDAATLARVRAIADAARLESEPLEEKREALHREMRATLDQAAPELDAVMRQADQIGTVDTELRKLHLKTLLEIRALLTPAQREALVRIHDERRAARGHRHRNADPEAPAPAGP